MQRQPRRIVLLRHAKAEPAGDSDLERELSSQGRGDAAAAGRWLADAGLLPEHALVSAAARTRQTWDHVSAAAGWDVEASFDPGLYTAGPDTALDLIRAAPAGARTLVVLGHNPTVAYLAQLLDDGEGDEAAAEAMAGGYPTCALTLFDYDGAWADLDVGSARLVAFHVGRA